MFWDWGLGTGDWGLGTGDWGLGTGDWGLASLQPPASGLYYSTTVTFRMVIASAGTS
jgi:hypothetical protein